MSSVIEEMCRILSLQQLQTMPLPPRDQWVGEEITPDDNAYNQEAGRRQKSQLAITFS